MAVTRPVRPSYRSLAEVTRQEEILKYWAAEESYYPTLHFDSRDTLWLEFDGQCAYRFPYALKSEEIDVYWDLIENCTHDIGIKKSFGIKQRPVKGKVFMRLQLVNDTTLKASYLQPEWMDRFNGQYSGYKFFPVTFLSVGDSVTH